MLDTIIRFSIKNKIIIALMTIMLVIWGVWSAGKLPIDAVPDITNNQVQIITVTPTLAGQEVEQLVTFPVEQSIANLPNLAETRSISRFGLSVVTAVFEENVDIYFARQLVSEALKEAVENIPNGVGTPEMAPVSTGLGEVYQYIIHPKEGSEDKYDPRSLREMQDWIVTRQLYGTKGVAEINSFGGELKQYEVAVNPYRLKAMGISLLDIFTALEQNNENTGGAYIDKKPNAYFIRGIGLVKSLEDVKNICVKSENGHTPIFIKDVADVRLGSAVRYGALTYNGEVDAVGGVVMMLKGENSNEVVKRIKEKLPTIQKSLPDDVIIEPYLDRTDLVGRTIKTVEKNLIEGALIVILVLVLFLGNLRAGLIVASAIPLSMLFALGLMNVFGVSANLMSLGAIDFGLIIDGAVIIVEATLHHLAQRKSTTSLTAEEKDREVYLSASKIRNSAAFGEIIILIVYIPILTLVGIEGKMFKPMAQTVSFAILGAFILSLTYIPMMSALFLASKPQKKDSISDRFIKKLQSIYTPLLEKAISYRKILISITLIIFGISVFCFTKMGGEFIPQLGEGDFAYHCILPQGSSLKQSLETSMQASRLIKEFDEVKMVVSKTGSAEVPTDPMPPEASDMMIILYPQSQWKSGRSYDELANAISEKLSAIPGVFFEKNQPIQMRFNELMTGIRQDVAVKIFGENLDTLAMYAEKVKDIVSKVEGTTEPQIEQITGLPQINVEYDRTRLANYGLNVSDVNKVLSTAFAGQSAGVVFENERRFDLVVRLDTNYRQNIDDVSNLFVETPNGLQVPIFQIAKVEYKYGPAQISREDGKRRIVIGFNVSGRDVQSVVNDIKAELSDKVKLPPAYYFTYGGQFENLQKATNRLLYAVPVSLLLILLLLFFTFHSFRHSLLIFTAIPMSAIGGIFALMLRGMPFSISAGIGFIALFGVSVLDGIVLLTTFRQLKETGKNLKDIVIEGTKTRLRPVLMTSFVAGLGFLPMAISTSAGAEVQKPLATVVIGGVISATISTLFILPLLYMIMETSIEKRKKKHSVKVLASALILLLPLFSNEIKAQNTLKTYTLNQLFDKAIENNGRVQAANEEIIATKLLKTSAFDFGKVSFNTQFGQYSSLEKDFAFSIEHTLPFPSFFLAKLKLAKAEHDLAITNRDKLVIDIKKDIREAFFNTQVLEKQHDLLVGLDSLYADLVTIVQSKYDAGAVSIVDLSTAKAKRCEIKIRILEIQNALSDAYAKLYTKVNLSEDFKIDADEAFLKIDERLLDSVALVENNIELQVLNKEKEIVSREKNLLIHESLPDINLAYTNQSMMGFYDINGQQQWLGMNKRFHSFTIGLAIPINIFSTITKVKSLKHKKQAITYRYLQQKKELEKDLKAKIKQYRMSLQLYDYSLSTALPNAEEIIKSARISYEVGNITYLEYVYSLEAAIEIKTQHLTNIEKLNQATINLLSLINK